MTTPPTISRRMERGILALFVAAAAVVGLSFLLPVIGTLARIIGGETPVGLLTGAEVPHETGTAGGVQIVSATYESAQVLARGLSDPARWMIGAGLGFSALTAALTVGSVALFLLLLMWKRPLHRALIVATQVAGVALLIGSMLAGGLGGLGRMMAATELNPLAEDAFVVGFSFDLAPLLAGVAVLGLSVVFQYGSRLQRDTEGLV